MSFKITKQYGQGPATTLSQRFTNLEQAKSFVNEQLEADILMGVQNTQYKIYDFDDLVSAHDKTNLVKTTVQQEDESAQGKGKSASFRPTPLSTTPRPPGSPQNWRNDDEDNKDK